MRGSWTCTCRARPQKMEGLELIGEVRRLRRAYFPILVLTLRGDVETEVRVFEAGANEFISKPLLPKVLLIRLHAMIQAAQRRSHTVGGMTLVHGPITLDIVDAEVRVDGEKVHLGRAEFRLLKYLMMTGRGGVDHGAHQSPLGLRQPRRREQCLQPGLQGEKAARSREEARPDTQRPRRSPDTVFAISRRKRELTGPDMHRPRPGHPHSCSVKAAWIPHPHSRGAKAAGMTFPALSLSFPRRRESIVFLPHLPHVSSITERRFGAPVPLRCIRTDAAPAGGGRGRAGVCRCRRHRRGADRHPPLPNGVRPGGARGPMLVTRLSEARIAHDARPGTRRLRVVLAQPFESLFRLDEGRSAFITQGDEVIWQSGPGPRAAAEPRCDDARRPGGDRGPLPRRPCP